MKVKLLADAWRRPTTDEDGNVTYKRLRKGAEFDVTNAEYDRLTRDSLRRPLVEKVETTEQKSTQTTSAKPATSGNK